MLTNDAGFTQTQIDILKKWGGFAAETASDADVLAAFGMDGTSIPSYFKHTAKWFIDDLTHKEFIDALTYFEENKLLGSGDTRQPPVEHDQASERLSHKDVSEPAPHTDVHVPLQEKVSEIRAISNNPQLRQIVTDSNLEFSKLSSSDLVHLMQERSVLWERGMNGSVGTDVTEQALTNIGTVLVRAILERDDEHLPIRSILVTNVHGAVVITTQAVSSYDQSDEKWWQIVSSAGRSDRTSEAHVSMDANDDYTQYHTEISLPVHGSDGEFIGVIQAQVDMSGVQLG